MQDTELYQQLLGLTAPWRVDRVDLSNIAVNRECGSAQGSLI